ncbi:MAG: hypothetical protein JO021_13425 [Alphaproteobacteria bacterium]|nr:hypothetical protein [Alphaproteobacteria bacterium]
MPLLRRAVPVALILIAIASWFSHAVAWLATLLTFVGYLIVAAMFAQSLRAGREPLIVMIIRLTRGSVPPEVLGYARRLTVIWAVVMTLLAVELVIVAAAEPDWLRIVATTNIGLIVALFAGEHVVRIMTFPHLPHYSALRTGRIVMQAFRDRR